MGRAIRVFAGDVGRVLLLPLSPHQSVRAIPRTPNDQVDFIGNPHLRLLQEFRTDRMLFRFRAGLLSVAAPDQSDGALCTTRRARVAMRISLSWAAKRGDASDSDGWRHLASELLDTFTAARFPESGRGFYSIVLRCMHLWGNSSAIYSGWPARRLVSRTRQRRHLRLYGQYFGQSGRNHSFYSVVL